MGLHLLAGESIREHNRRLVLEQISSRREVSRQEMVDSTGLSKAAVSSIVAELIELGLVHETGRQANSIGRPRVSLAFIPNARWLVGAEIDRQECRAILTNLYAETMRSAVQPVRSKTFAVDALLDVVQACVAEVTRGIAADKVLGLGICVPGMVDPLAGTVVTSVVLPWYNVALAPQLAGRFPYPVALFSRGGAATWGERWYGAGRAVENLLYVRVGSGVVGGLVIDGQPYWGRHFGAGELGHMTVQADGELCHCGNRGCLATVAAVDAMIARGRQMLRTELENPLWPALAYDLDRLTLNHLVRAADAGNPLALHAFAEVAHWLALAISAAIHLLDLEMVVIGGPIVQAGSHLFTPLRAELAKRTMPTHLRHVQVAPSALNEDAPAIGAASLVLHELISARRMTPAMTSSMAA
jgi:predicted NBD/HSP70 family sugar kinase